MQADSTSYTCPRCGMTSRSPRDAEQGYCGNCHDWTWQDAALITKTGTNLTEADVDALAEEAERGYNPDVLLSRENRIRQGARMLLEELRKRESFWRDRLGDEDYERALARWRAQSQS